MTSFQHIQDGLTSVGRRRLELPRLRVSGYGDVMTMKEDLAASLPEMRSLRDFGGCYLVHGRYLLQPARRRRLEYASMVDVNVLEPFVDAARALMAEHPETCVEWVSGDFRDSSTYAGLPPTDAALLYEVLLHQENYVEVMRSVCASARRHVCVAQPCLREELFPLPASATLLQFHDEAVKDLLRTDSFWPKEPRVDRFTTAHWMWGHTTSHIVDVMKGLGWTLSEGTVVDDVCGPCWEYTLLVFARG